MENIELVSIIICNYNYASFIGKAIESALNQTYKNTEVIVVDDGSTDNSMQEILPFRERVNAIFKKHEGQLSAFNVGFNRSSGNIICFLDSDDEFAKEKVETVVELLGGNIKVGWCFHNQICIDVNGNAIHFGNEGLGEGWQLMDLRQSITKGIKFDYSPPSTGGLCFRREILSRIFPMPVAISRSTDLFMRMAALYLSPGIHTNKSLSFRRIHQRNRSSFCQDLETKKVKNENYMKTAYYLRERFPELDCFSDRLFASAFGRIVGQGNLKRGIKCKEFKSYVAQSFSIRNILRHAPGVLVNIQRGFLDRVKKKAY